MGKYGQAAVEATGLLHKGDEKSPVDAWTKIMELTFPDSESSRTKVCPRSTYLGLCEEGLVRRIPRGNYTRAVENKRYAVGAVSLLKLDPKLADDESLLWKKVTPDVGKTPNSQMDVVCALWKADLLET